MSPVYELTLERVRQVVPSGSSGFYELGVIRDGEFHPRYIGRSDRDLQSRLETHNRQRDGVTHFRPKVTKNIRRAFELECREWHLHGEELQNKIHPDRPDYLGYECPYCNLNNVLSNATSQKA